ncbi:hypothetical protein ACK3SF_05270 [Candidatus Nanosalina sp. VS9-1]|uniref:hypothetical protein n=1 Tax=Candidatus Nanosalina sp. VS9-1 TaxID=3388566 RepID=UPI0039DF5923
MPRVELSELPENFRVKLSDKGKKDLWHRVDEFGGVKNLAEAFDYSSSKIYNWKSKDLALPVDFVRQIMGVNNTDQIILLKGPGSSGQIAEPRFPLEISSELLTRVEASVKENREGTPTYMASGKGLVQRFSVLLDEIGDVEYRVYSRESRHELRYPKFLQEIFSLTDFEEDLPALIDEKGTIRDGKIFLDKKEVPVEDFEGKLYSREKSFELALEKGDSEKIAELMAQESEKVKGLIGN